MGKAIISVEGLSKCYLVGHQASSRERYIALRDVAVMQVREYGRKAWSMVAGRQMVDGDEVEEFWALHEVSFEVKEGEVVGIIGRNGAGKSTLLKILSRITEPTAGRVTLRGRVASLLEVGTGFHPELTGRENVFLNGAILGMNRWEIRSKFDQIVDFAGVEQFLDTPVKRYSSGMYVRLAFSVAAHLEPEILIVDEVLAVGDAEFQKKCTGKMRDVARTGRTVLLVTHNLPTVRSLCDSGVLLSGGKIAFRGNVEDTLGQYQSLDQGHGDQWVPKSDGVIRQIALLQNDSLGDDLHLEVRFASSSIIKRPMAGIVISDDAGTPVAGFNSEMDPTCTCGSVGAGIFRVRVPDIGLHAGTYYISIYLNDGSESIDIAKDAISYHVTDNPLPAGVSKYVVGSMRLKGHWELLDWDRTLTWASSREGQVGQSVE